MVAMCIVKIWWNRVATCVEKGVVEQDFYLDSKGVVKQGGHLYSKGVVEVFHLYI